MSVAGAVPGFHLTAQPWRPFTIGRESYWEALEALCRFTATLQAETGAIIDPFLGREHQYSTPYFAFAVAALLRGERAADLGSAGFLAMEHATARFAGGADTIPDRHGEFFLASLPGALELYEKTAPVEQWNRWRERLRVPLERIMQGPDNNWRTYAMRGEWLRARLGVVAREAAVAFIEAEWRATQCDRIVSDRWNLYQDRQTDPESHAVEAVGRVNLLGLIAAGYDGPSAAEIRACAERGTAATLLLQDPSGQCAPNGRTDNHVFNDVLYVLGFELMAERVGQAGDTRMAGQYRRAAALSFDSIRRWRRDEASWRGSYFVTKNHFDPAQRVGYQRASNYGNYNGAVMLHLAEACLLPQSSTVQQPAPSECGGYALATDEAFASALANAGGMQMFVALRGDTQTVYDHYWTALGVERFARADWDTRLGPSDGIRDAASGRGVTFAPTWVEGGEWIRLADVPERYRGHFSVQFVHPLLVRCAIEYRVFNGIGPSFRHEFVLTPDGVLATLRCSEPIEFGVTWPLLENDGRELQLEISARSAATSYAPGRDQQCFLSLDARQIISADEPALLSSYGWLRPVRATAVNGVNRTFVYPRRPADAEGEMVLESWSETGDGFASVLGRVSGQTYRGRFSAGGEGTGLELDNGVLAFDRECRFVAELEDGRVMKLEADREVVATMGETTIVLRAYEPVDVTSRSGRRASSRTN